MKNNLLKFYIPAIYFCSTIVLFAQPGDTNDTDNLEGIDAPAAPIDNYIGVLALIALFLAYLKLRAILKQENKMIK